MTPVLAVLAGIALAIVARVLLVRALRWKLRRDLASGDRALPARFVNAGLEGEAKALWAGGPPSAMTMLVRFADVATGPDGERRARHRPRRRAEQPRAPLTRGRLGLRAVQASRSHL
jgi:hypothetical protein